MDNNDVIAMPRPKIRAPPIRAAIQPPGSGVII